MAIDLSNVLSSENREADVTASLEMQMFESKMGAFPITQVSPIKLHISNHENSRLTVSGDVELCLTIPCSRCLADVPTNICFAVNKDWQIADGVVSDEDAACMDGAELDVDLLISQEIMIHFPTKVLCREDCKGICRICGKNLNEGDCSCPKEELDPRMAAIQDIFQQFKEV